MANFALVQAGFGAPQRQSRWKVAIRLILAIPLILWFLLLSVAAGVLIFVGWFGALILGRLPYSFVRPLSDYIVFTTRLYSYLYLMNDEYPPFRNGKSFGVNVVIPSSKVRRWAVLFRLILMIPASIVSILVAVGVEVAAIFIWLIVLVRGEMPVSLFGALAAVLRFQARVYAYYMMITSKYPGELFGDAPIATTDPSGLADGVLMPDATTLEPPVHFGIGPSVAETSTGDTATSIVGDRDAAGLSAHEVPGARLSFTPGPPTGAPAAFPTDDASSPEEPRTARLVLSRASKNLLVLFLILGAVGYTAQMVLQNRLRNNASALTTLTTDNSVLGTEITAARAQETSCTLGTSACVTQYLKSITVDFDAFNQEIQGIHYPSGASGDAAHLESDSAQFLALLNTMSNESPITQAEANQLQTSENTFDTAYNQVVSDLASPV